MCQKQIRVLVWNEFIHEKREAHVAAIYPDGIHRAIADALERNPDFDVRTATLESPVQGLSEEELLKTDVLMWWGHEGHDLVTDENAQRVAGHVRRGMGFVPLHSAHASKPFMLLMGTGCTLSWFEPGAKERIWTVLPGHPVAQGIENGFVLPCDEMYGEPFDIPNPDEIVFLGWFKSGEVFRSGCVFHRSLGTIFYFQPGHETHPTYYHPMVQNVISNAIYFVNPVARVNALPFIKRPPSEDILL